MPPGQEVPAGDQRAAGLGLVAGGAVGVWGMTPGTATDVEADEVFVVVAGRGTVAVDDAVVIALAPGAVVRLRAGERTTWAVQEALRKVCWSA